MGLFDKNILDSVKNPTTVIRELPTIKLTRKQQEEIKAAKQNVQKKIEDVLYGIDYDLGNAAETIHKAENAISDTGQRLQDTFNNAKNATDPKTWITEFFMDEKMPHLGDHLKVQRSVYTHHGIYIGEGKVIHYLLKNVQIDTLEDFAKGSKIIILSEYDSPAKYSRNEIVNRAKQRLYENEYNLIINNCEHFCRWCRCGDSLK